MGQARVSRPRFRQGGSQGGTGKQHRSRPVPRRETVEAEYEGTCEECGGRIEPGDEIVRDEVYGWVHATPEGHCPEEESDLWNPEWG